VEDRKHTDAEPTTLRFAEIYQSPEWMTLDPISRAQLMLVAEGLKPGTMIHGNFTSFERIVKQMNLEMSLNTDPYVLEPAFTVATAKAMSEWLRQEIMMGEKPSRAECHRSNGELLGYPKCCTEEYIRPMKNIAERKQYSPKKLISNFEFELEQMLSRGESYPEELDFCPPPFTPCSATCPEARQVLRRWKHILEIADPIAAQELREFNWRRDARAFVHKTELEKKYEERHAEYLRHRFRSHIENIASCE